MAKMMPKQRPLFEVKDYVLYREEEINRYMAELDLPEYLAEAVYDYECWIADLADSACENYY
jgi:hypothetical protein